MCLDGVDAAVNCSLEDGFVGTEIQEWKGEPCRFLGKNKVDKLRKRSDASLSMALRQAAEVGSRVLLIPYG